MITEKELKEKEKKNIIKKAEYIETHSKEILKKLSTSKQEFGDILIEYLISNDDEITISDIDDVQNAKDYHLSLAVIFQICYLLNNSDLPAKEKENFRNKIRLYTKRFQITEDTDLRKENEFVKFDHDEYVKKRQKLRKRI